MLCSDLMLMMTMFVDEGVDPVAPCPVQGRHIFMPATLGLHVPYVYIVH